MKKSIDTVLYKDTKKFLNKNSKSSVSFKEMAQKYSNKDFKTADEYLTVPFLELINRDDFYMMKNEMKIITGVTGQGKTYHTAKTFIPYMYEHKGLEFFVVSVPQTEILDKEIFEDVAYSNGMIYVNNNPSEAMRHSKAGRKVLLTTTHQSFVVSGGAPLVDFLENSGVKFSVFIDEAHTWLVSDAENYKQVMGHGGGSSQIYEGKLFKALERLSKVTPYIFGLTATPNREQNQVIDTIGSMTFRVINKFPTTDLLIGRTAWRNETQWLKGNRGEQKNHFVENMLLFEKSIEKLFRQEWNTDIKKTMMICCANADDRHGYTLSRIKNHLENFLSSHNLASDNEFIYAVMVSEGNKEIPTGIYSVNGSRICVSEDSIKERLIDPKDPLRIVLVVQKGKMGMNINNLKTLVSFRWQDKRVGYAKDSEELIEFAVQVLGRLVRLNPTIPFKNFVEQYGYSLNEYVKGLSYEEKIKLIQANSFDILIPYTKMWRSASDRFTEQYVSTVQQAQEWLLSDVS